MATSATILNLHQLTDAALIGPDFGTVHFRLLHTTLQIMITQLGLQDLMIEFKGPESEMIQKIFDPKIPGGTKSTQYNITGNINTTTTKTWDQSFDRQDNYPTNPADPSRRVSETKPSNQSKPQDDNGPNTPKSPYDPPKPSYDAPRPSNDPSKSPHDAPKSSHDAPKQNYEANKPTYDAPKPSYEGSKASHDTSKPTHDSSRPSNTSHAPGVPKSQNISKSDGEYIRLMIADEANIEQEVKVINRRKDSKEDPDPFPQKFASPPRSSVIIVPTKDDREITPTFTVAVTTEEFERLTRDVHDLKVKYNELTKMSSNTELMKAVRTSTDKVASPVVDMYQILSLTKRVEAAELGMSKIASMIEDLAKEQVESQKLATTPGAPPSGGETVIKVIEKATKLRTSIDSGQGPISELLKEIEHRLADLERKFEEGVHGEGTHLPKIAEVAGPVSGDDFSKVDLVSKELGDALVLIQSEFKNVRNLIQALDVPGLQKKIDSIKYSGGVSSDKEAGIVVGGGGDISERMAQMEMHFNQCLDHINSLDKMFHGKMETVSNQISSLERELGSLTDKMLGIDDHVSMTGATEVNVLDLYKKFMELENVTNNIGQTAAELLDEREQRSLHMSALLEQIEELKTMKADKQDVEGQLADKVDICMINKKVSHEQFDATCMDLTRGIEDALEKLTRQEELWQQALTDIQTEVGSKLDKMEIGPLKEFITHKLGVLQAKLKALAKFKKEQEAAGTKAALLKDVKCISCDQDVVMRKTMDPSLYPQPPSLPPTKTMAPYLAYELDQLRKQQRTLNTSRNLNHFEQIKKGDACNRYCGGSHTLTTPQQRVTRLGHFLEQWGPEISMANDTEIKGKDGMIYKGEEKTEISILQTSVPPLTPKRPSMVVQGDILASRPEQPERLSISKPSGKAAGGVSFN
ncbi:hypothetical protein WA026_001466 [Henosepilachna vigintioctopunctata]|uniref:DUF4795 domain-containing protein n=1 Tax=Henosepilachna vigintioctopunctata TaxID=420089 RepID=A0AAW1US19_9CUCU